MVLTGILDGQARAGTATVNREIGGDSGDGPHVAG